MCDPKIENTVADNILLRPREISNHARAAAASVAAVFFKNFDMKTYLLALLFLLPVAALGQMTGNPVCDSLLVVKDRLMIQNNYNGGKHQREYDIVKQLWRDCIDKQFNSPKEESKLKLKAKLKTETDDAPGLLDAVFFLILLWFIFKMILGK